MDIVQPLLALQEVDGRLRDLQKELKLIPKRRAEEKARLAAAERDLTTARGTLANVKVRINASEMDLASKREYIEKLKRDQGSLRTNKEFLAINTQIERAENDIAAAQERRDSAQGQVSPETQALEGALARYDQEKATVDAYLNQLEEREKIVEEELVNVEAERERVVKNVPETALKYYERLKMTRWPCMTRFNLAADVCTGCNLVQPPSIAQQVRRNLGMVTCQSCGRILYSE